MPEPVPLALPTRNKQPVPDIRGHRILVVEDEYMLAEDLRVELKSLGIQVLGPVPSVAGALTLLDEDEARQPDGAILDVNLGGELVFPLADILRKRGVPILFVTGYDAQTIPAAYADVPRCEKPVDVGQCLRGLFGQDLPVA